MADDRNPPRTGTRVFVAGLPDGRVIARYMNGTYWIVDRGVGGTPTRKITLRTAAKLVVDLGGQVWRNHPGAGHFYTAVDAERARRKPP